MAAEEEWVRGAVAALKAGVSRPTLTRKAHDWLEDRDNKVPEGERRGWPPVLSSGTKLWKPLSALAPRGQKVWNLKGIEELQEVQL